MNLSNYDNLETLDCYQELDQDMRQELSVVKTLNVSNFNEILHTSLFP